MEQQYSANTIAKWFIAWADAEDADLSNLKLQKLLYYAQGWMLRNSGRPLFREPICAWAHGPVVPQVYRAFKAFGTSDIRLDNSDDFQWDQVDEEATAMLIQVWNTYGGYSAWGLRNMTHRERPWIKHFDPDAFNPVIPNDEIRDFFRTVDVPA